MDASVGNSAHALAAATQNDLLLLSCSPALASQGQPFPLDSCSTSDFPAPAAPAHEVPTPQPWLAGHFTAILIGEFHTNVLMSQDTRSKKTSEPSSCQNLCYCAHKQIKGLFAGLRLLEDSLHPAYLCTPLPELIHFYQPAIALHFISQSQPAALPTPSLSG
jgi:hypothetical protein